MRDVTLAIYNARRTERRDVEINARLTQVTITTAINRGFDVLRVGVWTPDGVYADLPEPLDLAGFSHVELWIADFLAFEGRLGPTSVPATTLVASGYWTALDDSWFASTDTTLTTTGAALRTVLANAAPLIVPASGDLWVDPETQHSLADFDGRTPLDALAQVTQEGDSASRTVDWFIYDGKRLCLKPRVAPGTPDYVMPFDSETMVMLKDESRQLSGMTVQYHLFKSGASTIPSGATNVTATHGLGITPAAEHVRVIPTNNPTNDPGNYWVDALTATTFRINVRNDPGASGASFDWFLEVLDQRTDEATNDDFIQRYEFPKRKLILAGSMTRASAEAIRDAALESASAPIYSGRITRDASAPFIGARGEPVEGYAVRSGQWFRVANLPDLIAVSTSYDLRRDRATVQVGSPLPTWEERIRRLQRATERRDRGLVPLTGGGGG